MSDKPTPILDAVAQFDTMNQGLADVVAQKGNAPEMHRELYNKAALAKLALNQAWLVDNPGVRNFYDETAGVTNEEFGAEVDSIRTLKTFADQGLLGDEDIAGLDERVKQLQVGQGARPYLPAFNELYPAPVVVEEEPAAASAPAPVTVPGMPAPRPASIPARAPEKPKGAIKSVIEVREDLKIEDVMTGKYGRMLTPVELDDMVEKVEDPLYGELIRAGAAGKRMEEMRLTEGSLISEKVMPPEKYWDFKNVTYPIAQKDIVHLLSEDNYDLKWLKISKTRGTRYFLLHRDTGATDGGTSAPKPASPAPTPTSNAPTLTHVYAPIPAPPARFPAPASPAIQSGNAHRRQQRPSELRTESKTAQAERTMRFSQALLTNILDTIDRTDRDTMSRSRIGQWMVEKMPDLTMGEAFKAIDNFAAAGKLHKSSAKGSVMIGREPVEKPGKTGQPEGSSSVEKADNSLSDELRPLAAATIDFLCVDLRHINQGETPGGIADSLRRQNWKVDADTIKYIARRLAERGEVVIDTSRNYGRARKGMMIQVASQAFKDKWKRPETRAEIVKGWATNTAEQPSDSVSS